MNIRKAPCRRARGFTLIEILMTLAVFGLIASLAVPAYQGTIARARIGQAIKDITHIEALIERHRTATFRLPANLDALGVNLPTDPWGNAFVYLNIEAGATIGEVRKDKNLNPLNSDYDLYSMGADGKTAKPLTAKAARDDIVRAGNGRFIGLAADH